MEYRNVSFIKENKKIHLLKRTCLVLTSQKVFLPSSSLFPPPHFSLSASQVTRPSPPLTFSLTPSQPLGHSVRLHLRPCPSPLHASPFHPLSNYPLFSAIFPSSNLAAPSGAAVQNRQRGLPTTSPPLIQIDAECHRVKVFAHHSSAALLKRNEAENYYSCLGSCFLFQGHGFSFIARTNPSILKPQIQNQKSVCCQVGFHIKGKMVTIIIVRKSTIIKSTSIYIIIYRYI